MTNIFAQTWIFEFITDNFAHMIHSYDVSGKLSGFKQHTWFAHCCHSDFYFDSWHVKASLEGRKKIITKWPLKSSLSSRKHGEQLSAKKSPLLTKNNNSFLLISSR